jgi:hypothetical protein
VFEVAWSFFSWVREVLMKSGACFSVLLLGVLLLGGSVVSHAVDVSTVPVSPGGKPSMMSYHDAVRRISDGNFPDPRDPDNHINPGPNGCKLSARLWLSWRNTVDALNLWGRLGITPEEWDRAVAALNVMEVGDD